MKQEFTFRKRDVVGLLVKLRRFFETLDENIAYRITIDKARKKRSLDANAYFWVLCNKVAEATNLPASEIYRQYVRDVGGNFDVLCVKEEAADEFVRRWSKGRLGWISECIPSKLPGCVTVHAYYGSSEYDSAQMSRLINLCIQDCRALDIETATPAELALLLENWRAG